MGVLRHSTIHMHCNNITVEQHKFSVAGACSAAGAFGVTAAIGQRRRAVGLVEPGGRSAGAAGYPWVRCLCHWGRRVRTGSGCSTARAADQRGVRACHVLLQGKQVHMQPLCPRVTLLRS